MSNLEPWWVLRIKAVLLLSLLFSIGAGIGDVGFSGAKFGR
jgi:hypothetical protein